MKNFSYALLLAATLAPAAAAQNLLTNPDFEAGSVGWISFGNAFAGEAANPPEIEPLSGTQVAKLFGNFTGGFDVSGILQAFPATGGDTFTMDCFSRHWSGDPLLGAGPGADNWAVMKMAFFDAPVGGAEIGGAEQIICDGTFPTDTWIDNPAVTGTAPAGTQRVEALILFLQPANDTGAVQVDDISFEAVAPPAGPTANLLDNPGFETGLSEWSGFGNQFPETTNLPEIDPLTGNGVAKLFGNFSGGFDVTGIFQTFGAEPGQEFTMDAASRHWSGDPLTADNFMVMKIAFFDAGGTEIGASEATILDAASPTDTWIDNAPISGTAPAGTKTVQALILFLQPSGSAPGAGQVDDIEFGAAASCDLSVNGGFETGDTTGWQEFPTGPGQITIVPGNGSASAVNINNTQLASASLIKNNNLGLPFGFPNPQGVQAGETITVTFDAKGSTNAGGVAFAELFSELSGGGVSFGEILGGAPLALDPDPNVWTTFSFTTTTGPDVSGGVTLQLTATTGGAPGSSADITYDNVSIRVERTSATWTNYGAGHPGTNGIPSLTLDANPYLGTTVNILAGSASTLPEIAVLLVGDERVAIPTTLGGTILNDITFSIPYALPPAGASLPLPVPALSYLCGAELYFQSLHLDLGASDDLAFSPGLRCIFGEQQ